MEGIASQSQGAPEAWSFNRMPADYQRQFGGNTQARPFALPPNPDDVGDAM